ncbi:MAG: HAD family hydrolase [Candidatus Kapabacteria bacterium]|nr:HAD family hydrolase [Candidatus Kapabacteria bacterium]
MKNKAVFFDRDGIINRRIVGEYVAEPDEFILNPEIPEILKYLKKQSFLIILITNQQGVDKGIMSLSELEIVHNFMQKLLQEKSGVIFDEIYYCTDLADTNSFYRKPNPGMLLDAIKKWDIDPSKSIMIGDSDSDVIAGKKAGTATILVNNEQSNANADFHIDNLSVLKSLLTQIIGRSANA